MIEIQFYNSLKKKKEAFTPIEAGKVKIYNCGVTVYDKCHLGHARGAINFDVLRRFLETLGYDVTYVKNYTDIDDKMINRATERGITVAQLGEENIALHDEDMASLGIRPPHIAPRATEHMPEIVKLIESLIKQGHAYESSGDVYFKVRSFEDYGKLSGKSIEDLISGHRVELGDLKEDPLDFALWKAKKEGEPFWASPWGEGRPGWHIECSAMSQKYLGETFDIHAGGSDLIFPHHENELAQSQCGQGKPFVNYWLHNGMIQIEAQKMSKSLGNFATISDLVKIYEPELIRFFILSSQYRASIDFSSEALHHSLEGLDRIYDGLRRAQNDWGELPTMEPDERILKKKNQFFKALADDLNTPGAIASLFELTRMLNTANNLEEVAMIYPQILALGKVLGLLEADPQAWFKSPRIKEQGTQELDAQTIEAMLEERIQARAAKNWAKADEIRDQLVAQGIMLEDKEGKTLWKRN